jgi:hypothetical protein
MAAVPPTPPASDPEQLTRRRFERERTPAKRAHLPVLPPDARTRVDRRHPTHRPATPRHPTGAISRAFAMA